MGQKESALIAQYRQRLLTGQDYRRVVNELIYDVDMGNLAVMEVIKSLGPYLTEQDKDIIFRIGIEGTGIL